MKVTIGIFILFSAFFASGKQVDHWQSSDFNWSGLFIAGDKSIANFDSARQDLSRLVQTLGFPMSNQFHFSMDPKYISTGETLKPTFENLIYGSRNLAMAGENRACFFHLTSHGIENEGFYLEDVGLLNPKNLNFLLSAACENRPTIVLISACFSGQFLTDQLKTKNRIILTASKSNLPSFGCRADKIYPFWDGCLISEMPEANTWKELHQRLKVCIAGKEKEMNLASSFPQAFFGEAVKDFRIFHK